MTRVFARKVKAYTVLGKIISNPGHRNFDIHNYMDIQISLIVYMARIIITVKFHTGTEKINITLHLLNFDLTYSS